MSMRHLISRDTTTEVASDCQVMLKKFVQECVDFYGSGFVSYLTHCLIHVVGDFIMFGSLDTVNSFPFESFLGRLKSLLHSVNEPFPQICQRAFVENENCLISAKLKVSGTNFATMKKRPGNLCKNDARSVAKVMLPNGCVIKSQSMADSTI